MQLGRFNNRTPARFEYISIMSFKLGHVSIPKRRIFLLLFLFCAYDNSVLPNFKIFTHLLPNFSYKDPRLTEVTYHCINFNHRVRKVPKNYYLNVTFVSRGSLYEQFGNKCVKILKLWRTELSYAQNKNRGKKIRLLGMDTCPSLNDIMEIKCNKCTRSEQGYDF
jgi:hypothetical protein